MKFSLQIPLLTRMRFFKLQTPRREVKRYEIRVGDKVLYGGEEFEVTRKRTGVDMYEIAKVHERYESGRPKILTHIHDGLRAEELRHAEDLPRV